MQKITMNITEEQAAEIGCILIDKNIEFEAQHIPDDMSLATSQNTANSAAVAIVKSLAKWSRKYPKSRIYNKREWDEIHEELSVIEKMANNFISQPPCPNGSGNTR